MNYLEKQDQKDGQKTQKKVVNHQQTNKHSTEIEVSEETLEEEFAKDVLIF